jgi:hypothetical protein
MHSASSPSSNTVAGTTNGLAILRRGAKLGSHISVVTMGADLTTVDGHIEAIKRWRDVYNSVR